MKNEILNTTLAYYSCWLGKKDIITDSKEEICFLYSECRNETQQGYAAPFDLYVFRSENRIIVSYGRKAKKHVDSLRERIKRICAVDELKQIICNVFEIAPKHNIKYVYAEMNPIDTCATILDKSHFQKFKAFFEECHNIVAGDWLYEWYLDMIEDKLCCGWMVDDTLVSCTDAPDMPYMQDYVQEIGITTLKLYEGRGYGTQCCLQCISNILKNGKVPIWSTTADNSSSQRLAEKVGFTKLADILTITI